MSGENSNAFPQRIKEPFALIEHDVASRHDQREQSKLIGIGGYKAQKLVPAVRWEAEDPGRTQRNREPQPECLSGRRKLFNRKGPLLSVIQISVPGRRDCKRKTVWC